MRMKKTLFLFALGITYICFSLFPLHAEEPEPEKVQKKVPEGFSFQILKDIGGKVLKPKGWFFERIPMGKTMAYRITQDEPNKDGEFLTGLTINVILQVPESSGISPSAYAQRFISEKSESGDVIESFKPEKLESMERSGVTVVREQKILGITQPFWIHYTIFANDKTGTLYIFVFGCPSKSLKDTLPTFQEMLSRIILHQDV